MLLVTVIKSLLAAASAPGEGGRRAGGAERRALDVLRLLRALPTPYDAAGKAQSLGKCGDAGLGMLGRSRAGGTGMLLFTSHSWKASPRNLQPPPNFQANSIHSRLCL